MNDIKSMGQPEIETKIKEAETCHSMGMMAEALQVYEQVLARLPGKNGQMRETIVARINLLKKEIESQEETENQGVSQEDISIFKKTLSGHDDVPTLLDGAAALKELGLMEEAIAEYDKLLKIDFSKFDYSETDYSPIKIVCDYLTCLLDVKPPEDVVKDAYRVIYKQNIKEKETAQVKFWLGLQLEKKNHFDLAYDLYEAAAAIDNTNTEVIERINSLKSRISSSSRYDYLIRNKIVNTNQLQEALTIAKNMNKSVEFVLVDRSGVKKAEVGKSLSQYFGCKFRDFDEELPIPFELISKLKMSFLL